MPLPAVLRNLPLPVIGAPLFIVSNPKLVIAQCTAGIVGAMPALNARPAEQLDGWIAEIAETLGAWNHAHPCGEGRQVVGAPQPVGQACRGGQPGRCRRGGVSISTPHTMLRPCFIEIPTILFTRRWAGCTGRPARPTWHVSSGTYARGARVCRGRRFATRLRGSRPPGVGGWLVQRFPLVVADADSWLFEGTGLGAGARSRS